MTSYGWLGGRAQDPALVFGDRSLTFAALDDRAERVAAGLVAAGCAPGDRVLALLPPGIELFELLLGCVRAGLVLVPMNWRLTEDELLTVARDARATALVSGEAYAGPAAALLERTSGRAHLRIGPSDWYERWLADQHPPAEARRPEPAPGDVVLQIYTSGTSGAPKGVLLTAANLAAKVPRAALAWDLGAGSVSLLATPLFHVGGLGWGLAGLHAGARTIVATSAAPTDLLVTLRTERITHTFLVPTMIERMCALAGTTRLPDLHTIIYGAAPIDPRTRRAATDVFGCRLLHVYGLTETTGAITQLDAGEVDPLDPRTGSVGRPYPWVAISVRDPRTGAELPPGRPGEIWTRSAQNTPGYHRDDAATAELYGPGGWLRTGDGGYLDADGYLFVTHRIKDLIISGGENVNPGEVEEVLRQHADVADVAVVGLPDRSWGEVVTAVVVPRPGRALTEADVLAYAHGRLAGYKRPRRARIVASLPRTATGKVLKHRLVAQIAATEAT
ncbi:AMP-binding protein [Dactylosporangium sp. NPDC005572]|uniref:class I adenylate-forming enzyme family protein n=1 Tax=Dactylosporangium sp. NPDC005572 TaxID=3156889 RepID=UPI00339EA61C